jgi:hypothetical protein
MILRVMTNKYPESLVSAHFNMFISMPPDAEAVSNMSEKEKQRQAQEKIFYESGIGYFQIQNTKVSVSSIPYPFFVAI